MYVHDNQTKTGGFVMAADDGQAFWFLNTLTINKVSSDDSQGQLSIVDHRVPPGFAPPPHIHQASDEAFLVLDGEFEGFCGDQAWQAGPGSLGVLAARDPARLHRVRGRSGQDHRGRVTRRIRPVRSSGGPAARDLRLPEPVAPDPARITQLAAAHGIRILPPPQG